MTSKIRLILVLFGAASFGSSCGSGIDAFQSYVSPIRPELSQTARSFARAPQNFGQPYLFFAFLNQAFGMRELVAASTLKVPNLHFGADSPIFKKAESSCLDLDTVAQTADAKPNAFIAPPVPKALKDAGQFYKIPVGSKIIWVVNTPGQEGAQPGKEKCGYSDAAITSGWVFSFVGGTCLYATLDNGPNDGEAIVTGITDSGVSTCAITATGRDKTGAISVTENITFQVVLAGAAVVPAITSLSVNGVSVGLDGAVKVDLSEPSIRLGVLATQIQDTYTDWRTSFGAAGTAANFYDWKSPGKGSDRASALVTAVTPLGVMAQVKFLWVE